MQHNLGPPARTGRSFRSFKMILSFDHPRPIYEPMCYEPTRAAITECSRKAYVTLPRVWRPWIAMDRRLPRTKPPSWGEPGEPAPTVTALWAVRAKLRRPWNSGLSTIRRAGTKQTLKSSDSDRLPNPSTPPAPTLVPRCLYTYATQSGTNSTNWSFLLILHFSTNHDHSQASKQSLRQLVTKNY